MNNSFSTTRSRRVLIDLFTKVFPDNTSSYLNEESFGYMAFTQRQNTQK